MKMKAMYKNEILKDFVDECKKKFGKELVSIVLFGSMGRGIADTRSDIDLIIVVDGNGKNQILKDIRIEFLLKYEVKLDILLLTKKDVIDNFKAFSPLFSTFALGVDILYDRGFFEKQLKKFGKKLEKTRIRYCEGGKIWDLQKIGSKSSQ
jgi:predicted nucleotidyltransferase